MVFYPLTCSQVKVGKGVFSLLGWRLGENDYVATGIAAAGSGFFRTHEHAAFGAVIKMQVVSLCAQRAPTECRTAANRTRAKVIIWGGHGDFLNLFSAF